MSASRRRNRSRDPFYQANAIAEEDDDSSSSSLSPSSRALAIADRIADAEDGANGDANTSEDGGSSDLSLVLGMRSMGESFDLEEFGAGEDRRANRIGYIQERRGRLHNHFPRHLNQPMDPASPATSRALLDDSWQENWKGLKHSPTETTGVVSEACGDGVLGNIGDGMQKLSILDVSFNGRKHAPKERVKVTLRSTFVPGGGRAQPDSPDQSENAAAADPASPEIERAMTEIVPSDVTKTPSVDAHPGETGWVYPSLLDDSPMNAKRTGAIALRMEGSGETARLTSESMATLGTPDASARVTGESSASLRRALLGGSVLPREKPKLLEHELSMVVRDVPAGSVADEDCPNVGSPPFMAGGGLGDRVAGLNSYNPLVVGAPSFAGKTMGESQAARGLSPDSAGDVSVDSANLEVIPSCLRRMAGDSSKLESDEGNIVGKIGGEDMEVAAGTQGFDKGQKRVVEGSRAVPEKRAGKSKEDADRDGLRYRSEQQFWKDVAVEREQKATREFNQEGVKDEGGRRVINGTKGSSLFAGAREGLPAFDGIITAARSGESSQLSLLTKTLSVRSLDCKSGPRVLRSVLDGRDCERRGYERLSSQSRKIKEALSAKELVAKFQELERMWAPFSPRGHRVDAAPDGDKILLSPGRLVLPETETFLRRLRLLVESLKAHVKSWGGDAPEVQPSSDRGKPLSADLRGRGPKPSALTVTLEDCNASYSREAYGVRTLGQKKGNRQQKQSAGGVVSTATRLPRSSINAVKARLRGATAAGAGGSTRLSRGIGSGGLKSGRNHQSAFAREPHGLFSPSKTTPSGRGWPTPATAAWCGKPGARGPSINQTAASKKSIPSARSPTSPRPPRVSLSKSAMGKIRSSVAGKAPGVRGGKAAFTGARKGNTIQGDAGNAPEERGAKGGSKGTPSRKQRLQRKPAPAPAGRSRKPSLSIKKPRVEKASGGLASTSRLPSGNGGPRFFFSAKSSGQSFRTKSVSSPIAGLRPPDLDDISPRSRKKMALKVFGIDDSIPSPPPIGRMLMDAATSGKAGEGLLSSSMPPPPPGAEK